MPKAKKTTGSKDTMPNARARRDRILVALSIDPNPWIREEMDARGWRPVNLSFSSPPEGAVPRGALVNLRPDHEVVLDLLQKGCSVVRLADLPCAHGAGVADVLTDLTADGRAAAEHFFGRAFRDVAYFGRDPWGDLQLLFDGFRERAEALGMTCHLYRSKQKLRGESGQAKAERRRQEFIAWLRQLPKPVGVLFPGEVIAAIASDWALRAGFSVPEDVAILSRGRAGASSICETTMPTISSIDVDERRQLRTACDLLERLMAGEPIPEEPILIPSKDVTERESTNLLATPDAAVATAMRYMWDHLDLDLSVDDAARVVGISSRQLARRFQRALNRTFSEELLRKRLVEMKRLLRTTDHPIADLAPIVGFRTDAYLYRTFRAAFSMTPSQYRRSRR
jgi:LacI family transcriptional regulator